MTTTSDHETSIERAAPASPVWHGRADLFDLSPEVRAFASETIAIRRLLHRHAEPSWHEGWTAAAIEERLRGFGFDQVQTYAETGRAALLRGAKPGPTVLYRADI